MISAEEFRESKYDRAERITWWDQSKLLTSRVLVVGAGALGNELVKNLALVGVGKIDIVDMDSIEHTNLARCIFFREGDEGKFKASTLAEAAGKVNPDCIIQAFDMKVQELGQGSFLEYDLVLGGLDNREARLWVNATCRHLGITWIDGAIEGLQGLVRTFGVDGPCYECTLGEKDWEILTFRKSCALLSPEEMKLGRTPTNATTSSVVAGFQVQEAIKYLVGRSELSALQGKSWNFLGESMSSWITELPEDPDCFAHMQYPKPVHRLEIESFREIVNSSGFGEGAVIDFPDDFLSITSCPKCGVGKSSGLRGSVPLGAGRCQVCDQELAISSVTRIGAKDEIMDLNILEMNWPLSEIVICSEGDRAESFALSSRRS